MAVFQDVVFGFKGEEYTVKSNKIMRLIAMIEDIVSLGDITRGEVNLSRLAEAYSACLNYAGAETEIETVYETMFGIGSAPKIQEAATGTENRKKAESSKEESGIVKNLFITAVSNFGIAPSEFWGMHPQEFWWLAEAKVPDAFKEPQRKRLLRLLEKGWNG